MCETVNTLKLRLNVAWKIAYNRPHFIHKHEHRPQTATLFKLDPKGHAGVVQAAIEKSK